MWAHWDPRESRRPAACSEGRPTGPASKPEGRPALAQGNFDGAQAQAASAAGAAALLGSVWAPQAASVRLCQWRSKWRLTRRGRRRHGASAEALADLDCGCQRAERGRCGVQTAEGSHSDSESDRSDSHDKSVLLPYSLLAGLHGRERLGRKHLELELNSRASPQPPRPSV